MVQTAQNKEKIDITPAMEEYLREIKKNRREKKYKISDWKKFVIPMQGKKENISENHDKILYGL